MNNKIYKPALDKLFLCIWIPLIVILISITILSLIDILTFVLLLFTDIFTFYFLFSSLAGYVELKEDIIFVKFGFIIKREIPYNRIRRIYKERKIMTDTMLSLKNAMEHVVIKYNKFDMVAVSVKDNDTFIKDLEERINNLKENYYEN